MEERKKWLEQPKWTTAWKVEGGRRTSRVCEWTVEGRERFVALCGIVAEDRDKCDGSCEREVMEEERKRLDMKKPNRKRVHPSAEENNVEIPLYGMVQI